ncbi:unnamed protein product [Clavelina lepadiformis]|uniref:C2H2-type domain-containing protein n=1 Tax=Clavelina lepadiformis TaxID=159417 RepID=A0ABP0GB68_CLALP
MASTVVFQCTLPICNKEFHDMSSLRSHIKCHIRKGHLVKCPECDRQYRLVSSFSSHISRCHFKTNDNVEYLVSSNVHQLDNSEQGFSSTACIYSNMDSDNLSGSSTVSRELSRRTPSVDMGMLTWEYALFYCSLQYKHLIPDNTINEIISKLGTLQAFHKSYYENCFKELLSGLSANPDEINNLLSTFSKMVAPFSLVNEIGPLRSSYSREQYYSTRFTYVDPIAFKLNPLEVMVGRGLQFHYVPILKSIQALFSNDSVKQQFLFPENSDPGLHDIRDGLAFQQSDFFQQYGMKALQIVLYQDSFEVCNPLGAAKSKHKIFAVYFALGNIYKHCRSKIDCFQLVLLCKEKYLHLNSDYMASLFAPLIADLKILENEGIDVGVGDKLRGTVLCITGDNLGSHWVGGFTTNFSSSCYMCRYCKIKRSSFVDNCLSVASMRTIESYNTDVLQSSVQENGLKFASPFNELRFFHVAQPGLPPCLAHDLFEGVVAYDLPLIIKHFVSIGWFDLTYLNHQILNFPYSDVDRVNRPSVIKKLTKLNGTASQNWCFLRMLPLLIFHKVQDSDDMVWQMFTKLNEIVRVICAPDLCIETVCMLNVWIREYIACRHTAFADVVLRPKHHYLCHYPWLILHFGPLINVWTLRFESKHQYFKRVVKHSGNYINITSTLAKSHQMLQAYLLETNFFNSDVQFLSSYGNDFSSEISTILRNFIDDELSQCKFYKKIVFKGTEYAIGKHVVLEKLDDELLLGEIVLFFVKANVIYALVTKHTAVLLPQYGAFELQRSASADYKCIDLCDIYSFYPLHCYVVNDAKIFVLKHALN